METAPPFSIRIFKSWRITMNHALTQEIADLDIFVQELKKPEPARDWDKWQVEQSIRDAKRLNIETINRLMYEIELEKDECFCDFDPQFERDINAIKSADNDAKNRSQILMIIDKLEGMLEEAQS